jgi:hypothetical protein
VRAFHSRLSWGFSHPLTKEEKLCFSKQTVRVLFLVSILSVSLDGATAFATGSYFSTRLGISLSTLQEALGKVAGPAVFAPRPGGSQGTQEARLPGNAGIVQAGGDRGNLTTVVLWLPVDTQGKLIGPNARLYLNTFIRLFTPDSESVVLWVDQVLGRALAESKGAPHLEALLSTGHQFKATYMPTLSPAMLSLSVAVANE